MAEMIKYRVLRDCHWNYGYWDKDRIVEFPTGKDFQGNDHPVPPEIHFERLDGQTPRVNAPVQKEPATLSDLAKATEDVPNTGMLHDPAKGRKPKKAA